VRDSKRLPLADVVVGDVAIVLRLGAVSRQVGNGGHGFNGDHAFESQVGLVPELPLITTETRFIRTATHASAPAKSSVEI